ncbi:protein artichoke [Chironomus tepperi]|uniref:protein artichoke n=1 Tax=Chironomus tepperi TaxID=113505 RepID=UPI00391F806F
MRSQLKLVLLLIGVVACVVHATTEPNLKDNEILKDDIKATKRESKLLAAQDPRLNKMIQLPKDNQLDGIVSTKGEKKNSKSSTEKASVKDDALTFKNDKLEGDMIKDISHADVGKDDIDNVDATYDDYYDDEGEFSDEDDDDDDPNTGTDTNTISNNNTNSTNNTETKPATNKTEKKTDDDELIDDEYNDNEGEEDSDDELEEDDLNIDANKIEMKQCPRDCICERNMHAYFVATCSRLDLETQSFANLPITDLQVIDIGPQYPIVLGVEFFKKIGLENVTSIKIANSSIEYISPSAFNGLNELYSINLTSIGIDLIHPDTFANNTKLKILTLSGNNLNVMQSLSSPYTDYMLKSPSIEELDISNCNMQAFLPTAFSQMKNIIYINLAGNKLETLPEGLFDKTETIEELDLSYNKIVTLPKNIFNKTSLAILHLKYNEIVSNLEFITKDVQKLDISYNRITTINNQMFKNMENLSFLSLKGNKIKRINPAAFVPLKNLRHIDLSFNDLDSLSSLTFLKNSDLEVIRINDNIRLKTLPADGFETNAKSFHVFLFDASNCDLSNLGENTFKTMPFITRLSLSGNNIENIPKNLFSPLLRLMDLDLSNNLIATLNQQIFWNNQDLQMLNLAANPLESLSPKIFQATPYLQKLDVSDCDLVTLWHDSSMSIRVGELLKNLKVFNASNNDIKNIYASDLSTMKNLKVFDLKNNPLECNDEFRNLMKFLGQRKISLGNRNNFGELEEMKLSFSEEMSPAVEWNELARKICKRNEENKLNNEQVLDEINDEDEYDDVTDDDDDDDDDDDNDDPDDKTVDIVKEKVSTKKPIVPSKAPKEKSTARPKTTTTTTTAAPAVVDSNNENDTSEGEDEYEYNEEDADDDEEDREDESIAEQPDKNLLPEVINVIKKVENRIFGGPKFDDDEEEEVIIEEAVVPYRFIWPMMIVMLSILIVLLVIMFVISSCMRRRGERYRQALLQSKKNSIIYQKLSEEIIPQTPRVHRYTPIAQV